MDSTFGVDSEANCLEVWVGGGIDFLLWGEPGLRWFWGGFCGSFQFFGGNLRPRFGRRFSRCGLGLGSAGEVWDSALQAWFGTRLCSLVWDSPLAGRRIFRSDWHEFKGSCPCTDRICLLAAGHGLEMPLPCSADRGTFSQDAKLERFKGQLDQQCKRLPQENSGERTRRSSQRSLCAGHED
jgi:hypothetical protein